MAKTEVDPIKGIEIESFGKQNIENDEKIRGYTQIQVKDMILEKLKQNEKILRNYESELSDLNKIDTNKLEDQIRKLEEKAIKHNFFRDSIINTLEKSPTINQIQIIIEQRKKEINSIKKLYESIKNYLKKIKLSNTIFIDLEMYNQNKLKSNLNENLQLKLDESNLNFKAFKDGGKNISDDIIESIDKEANKTSQILADIYWTLDYVSEKGNKTLNTLENFGKGTKITMGIGAAGVATSASIIAASAITGSTVAGVTVTGSAAAAAGGIAGGFAIGATTILGSTILATGLVGGGIAIAGLIGYGIYRLIKWIKNRRKK